MTPFVHLRSHTQFSFEDGLLLPAKDKAHPEIPYLPGLAAKDGQGINVNSPEKVVDMVTNGVVDPVMVTKQALQNAVSIAATAMTMGALVVDVPEKEAPAAPAGGGMGMY